VSPHSSSLTPDTCRRLDHYNIITTQIKERFNENSSPLLKDLSLFQRTRIKESSENNSNMPNDAFNGLEAIYKNFILAKDLRREYLQFVNIYLTFEPLSKLPKKLHGDIDSIIHYETDDDDIDDDEEKNEKHCCYQNTINHTYNVFYLNGLKDIFPSLYEAFKFL